MTSSSFTWFGSDWGEGIPLLQSRRKRTWSFRCCRPPPQCASPMGVRCACITGVKEAGPKPELSRKRSGAPGPCDWSMQLNKAGR